MIQSAIFSRLPHVRRREVGLGEGTLLSTMVGGLGVYRVSYGHVDKARISANRVFLAHTGKPLLASRDNRKEARVQADATLLSNIRSYIVGSARQRSAVQGARRPARRLFEQRPHAPPSAGAIECGQHGPGESNGPPGPPLPCLGAHHGVP